MWSAHSHTNRGFIFKVKEASPISIVLKFYYVLFHFSFRKTERIYSKPYFSVRNSKRMNGSGKGFLLNVLNLYSEYSDNTTS